MEKGSTRCIPVVRRAVPESWGTSNGTFQTKKVGDVEISFVDYSDSKRVHLKPDIVDPYEKQEKTKIKVKIPDGTNYQNCVNHIIAMIQLIQQKDLENSVEKVFVAASDIEEKVGPLYKKLNMSKSSQEKESLKQKIETTEKDLEKA